ncbi:DUF4189 domain-containing protein [Pseudomonas sp. CDFA 553]|uniref:DUF4189 domain-containing protein n=1 Tax=Pseudomonas quasicaspiana TaxID=2829821 RepID=UPI001E37F676|nr:DUF4189 domain-containing protein [Pseudomonas quasicaspiana]MCD5987903.1 DUF4189 domain-containing protein [Pseudomonas quasicaspiana]
MLRTTAFSSLMLTAFASAFAQTACPGGVAPGSPQCGPDSGTSRADSAPARPTGEWIKTWGAIAMSKSTGEVGTVVGKLSEGDAKISAIKQCAKGGANDCAVQLFYRNQCAALAASQVDTFFQSSPIQQLAESGVKKVCDESGGGTCKVLYSECTEPLFRKY